MPGDEETLSFLLTLDPDAQDIKKAVTEANRIILEHQKSQGGMGSATGATFFGGISEKGGAFAGVAGGAAGMAAAAFSAGYIGLKKLASAAEELGAAASPGSLELFNQALWDLKGVLGGPLVPVLQLMTDGVRLFADVMANLLPSASEVTEAIEPLREGFAEFARAMRELAVELGPTFRTEILDGIKEVAYFLAAVAKAASDAAKNLKAFLEPLLDVVGKPEEGRGSPGAGARRAQFSGIADYQRQLQQAAFSGGALTISQQQLGSLNRIEQYLNAIRPTIMAIEKGIEAIVNVVQALTGNSETARKAHTQEAQREENIRKNPSLSTGAGGQPVPYRPSGASAMPGFWSGAGDVLKAIGL